MTRTAERGIWTRRRTADALKEGTDRFQTGWDGTKILFLSPALGTAAALVSRPPLAAGGRQPPRGGLEGPGATSSRPPPGPRRPARFRLHVMGNGRGRSNIAHRVTRCNYVKAHEWSDRSGGRRTQERQNDKGRTGSEGRQAGREAQSESERGGGGREGRTKGGMEGRRDVGRDVRRGRARGRGRGREGRGGNGERSWARNREVEERVQPCDSLGRGRKS